MVNEEELKNRKCVFCGEKLCSTKSGKKFCSDNHKIMHFYKIQREERNKYKGQIIELTKEIPLLFKENGELDYEIIKEIKEMI